MPYAIRGLLSQMEDVKRRMQGPLAPPSDAFQLPQDGMPQGPPAPQAPPLLAPQQADPFANIANANVSDINDPTHGHKRGLRGGLLHALGADKVAPEVAALLSPDQVNRVKPGLLGTVWNAINYGVGPQTVMQARAKNIVGLQDDVAKRQDAATLKQQMSALRQKYAPVSGETPNESWNRMKGFAAEIALLNPQIGSQLSGLVNSYEPEAGKAQSPVSNLSWIPDPTVPGGYRQLGTAAPKEPQYETFDGWRQMSTDGGKTWTKLGRSGSDSSASGDAALNREMQRANPLSTAFQRETERHQVVAESLTTLEGMREAALRGDGPAQHMLVFSLMKLADPGSAVRQDERADTKNAANVPEQLRAQWNKLLGGGGSMSPETVRGFLKTVDSTKAARIKDFDALVKRFRTRAGIAKVNPEYVVTDYFENVRGGATNAEKKKLSASDLAKAKADPQFAAWARNEGYEVP